MFLSIQDKYYWSDNIVRYTWSSEMTAGDLVLVGGQYAVALGDEVARWCDYELGNIVAHIAEPWLLSPTSVAMIHRMVKQRYSSYRKVIPLWLGGDVSDLLKRKPQTPRKSSSWSHLVASWSSRVRWDTQIDGQQCLIFPDLRTMFSSVSEAVRKDSSVAILSSSMTEKQRNDARWSIAQGKTRIVLSTPAAFFQNWHLLSDIQIIDPHLRYYKNRQNPRYGTSDVVKKMRKISLSTQTVQ